MELEKSRARSEVYPPATRRDTQKKEHQNISSHHLTALRLYGFGKKDEKDSVNFSNLIIQNGVAFYEFYHLPSTQQSKQFFPHEMLRIDSLVGRFFYFSMLQRQRPRERVRWQCWYVYIEPLLLTWLSCWRLVTN